MTQDYLIALKCKFEPAEEKLNLIGSLINFYIS